MIDFNLDEEILSSLNKRELELLKYIYLNADDIVNKNIQQLSKEVFISSSSIMRFCNKIGLSGFSELKYIIRTKLENRFNNIGSEISLSNIQKNLLTDIEGSLGFTSSEDIKSIVELLASSKDLYLYYPGGITDTSLDYLERQLLLNGRHNIFQLHSSKTANHFSSIKKDAIFLFISASGTYSKTIQIAKNANSHGITCVSISPFFQNEIASLCKYNLRFFTSPKENSGADYTSRFVIYFIIDILINLYIEKVNG
ncbi:MAG: MurR/RpiR family transcriptional regulator [Erysipelotrichaceae bacterium]|nr:MurR/RpiR family transcriptional regulator [Erysipelotrichaceae bacterium]MDY6034241.1 MurR/RpiR family transcriptional regulator [Bulleidia sp.]